MMLFLFKYCRSYIHSKLDRPGWTEPPSKNLLLTLNDLIIFNRFNCMITMFYRYSITFCINYLSNFEIVCCRLCKVVFDRKRWFFTEKW